MTFAQKLDLLMNITNTTNSTLALHVSIDPSFVSRLRRGIRIPAKNENYIRAISTYIAKQCSAEYQRVALADALNITLINLSSDMETIAEFIYQWVLDKKASSTESVENFVEDLIQFKFKKTPQISDIDVSNFSKSIIDIDSVLYGIDGKRNAVISFLCLILKNKSPQTLLLYSDEEIDWLTGKREFTAKWASLLSQVILNGNKIKIIHTVNRSLDEMLSAIKEWLPIYMTGSIEPYYYPKARDGVFRRTLFIAPETAAVASTSIGNNTRNAANFFYTDKITINALIEEYNNFLSLCRPLMRIYTSINKEGYLSTLSEFEIEEAHSIIKTSMLSSITAPMSVVENLLSHMDRDKKEYLLHYHKNRIIKFESNLKNYEFIEIFPFPDVETIKMEGVNAYFSDLLNDTQLVYTSKDFILHIQNIIRLITTFDNFNICIENAAKSANFMIYAKEDVGIIVAKTSLPAAVFAINESNMTAAFWNYLRSILKKISKGKTDRNSTIVELEAIIEKLRG